MVETFPVFPFFNVFFLLTFGHWNPDQLLNHYLTSHVKKQWRLTSRKDKCMCWTYSSLTSVQYCMSLLSLDPGQFASIFLRATPTPFYLSQLLHTCTPFLAKQNNLQLGCSRLPIDQRIPAVPPDFHTFTLAAERGKRVNNNNESDDGGGRDGGPLWLDQQAAGGGGGGPQLEMCSWLPGANLSTLNHACLIYRFI